MNTPLIFDNHRKEYERLLEEAKVRGYKTGWVYYQMKEQFGEEIAKQICEKNDEYEEW